MKQYVKEVNQQLAEAILRFAEPNVEITDLRVGLECTECGQHWGIRIDLEKDLFEQLYKFMCMSCVRKRREEMFTKNVTNVRNADSGHSTQK